MGNPTEYVWRPRPKEHRSRPRPKKPRSRPGHRSRSLSPHRHRPGSNKRLRRSRSCGMRPRRTSVSEISDILSRLVDNNDKIIQTDIQVLVESWQERNLSARHNKMPKATQLMNFLECHYKDAYNKIKGEKGGTWTILRNRLKKCGLLKDEQSLS